MPTQPWLQDILDQLAIAAIMGKSPVGAAQRLSLIVVDNAVEYMLKVYVDTHRFVAKGSRVGPNQISPTRWEEISRVFPKLVNFVQSKAGLAQGVVDSVKEYHDIRNDLYHGAKPQRAYSKDFDKYLELARGLLATLFSYTMSESDWHQHIESVRLQIFGEKAQRVVRAKRLIKIDISETVVVFETEAELSLPEKILVVVYSYLQKKSRPTRDQISESLIYSAYHADMHLIIKRLWDLVNKGFLRKIGNQYSMREKGRIRLQEKFSLEVAQ